MTRRRMPYAIDLAIVGLVLVMSACGSDDTTEPASDDPAPSSGPTTSATPTNATPTNATPTNATPPPTSEPSPSSTQTVLPTDAPTEEPMPDNGPVTEAITDLADRTGVSPDDIRVVAYDRVTWRNGSLGCPEPGKMYTQALVDGYRIVLRAAGETVHYHGSTGGSPFRCDHPDPNGAVDQGA